MLYDFYTMYPTQFVFVLHKCEEEFSIFTLVIKKNINNINTVKLYINIVSYFGKLVKISLCRVPLGHYKSNKMSLD